MLWITGAYFDTANGAPSFGVLKGDPSTGAVTTVADLQAYEVANNPDPYLVESNPYGLAFGPDGMLWVNDAAGNDLLEIDPSTGAVSLITTFEGIALPDIPETFNPDRGGAHESDPVPTGIAFAPDGHAFVGFLTGFPFMEGAAKVVHVDHDGEVSDAVTGLTMVVDVEVGPNDDIYATEFGRFSLTTTPPGFQANSGRVVRSLTNGTLEVIASGLNEPNGIALDKSNGNLYVVTNSNSPAGTGQVLLYSPGGGGVIGMPVTGEGDTTFLVAAVLAAILLIMGGVALRTLQARRTH
jgi:DNA-binding beta-propeller fold protein YncE